MTDELSNEVIPEGKEIINNIMVETVEPTEDPVEQFSRPTRERNEPDRCTYHQKTELEHKQNLYQQAVSKNDKIEYREDEALVVARFLEDIRQKYLFGQQYMLEKGIKKFSDRGIKSTEKEIGQLHNRECFRPI